MNVDYNVSYANKKTLWSQDVVKSKLKVLGNINGKKVGWIRSDLSVKKSNWFTRLIWTTIAKHFSWMRKHLYGVDLKQSRSLLCQIGEQLPKDYKIKNLYYKAVEKFNQTAPRHSINPIIEKINIDPKCPLSIFGFVTKEQILTFVKVHGKELTSLNLRSIPEIENADLEKFIEYCPNLNHLFLHGSEINDQALFLISSRLTSLQRLNLRSCDLITDEGLEHLKGLTSLQRLNLECCDLITDAGLEHLKGLTSLQRLNLNYCKRITDAGVKELKKELPNLKINKKKGSSR